jgi:hypothetical protein
MEWPVLAGRKQRYTVYALPSDERRRRRQLSRESTQRGKKMRLALLEPDGRGVSPGWSGGPREKLIWVGVRWQVRIRIAPSTWTGISVAVLASLRLAWVIETTLGNLRMAHLRLIYGTGIQSFPGKTFSDFQ